MHIDLVDRCVPNVASGACFSGYGMHARTDGNLS